MPLAGKQLTYGWALALCYHAGWRGKELETAVAVMTAESLRYVEAWHDNVDEDGNILSTDWGLFQINDKAQDIELPYHLEPIPNAEKARDIYKGRGKSFSAWAAYNSGRYLQFLPEVQRHRALMRWRNKVPKVVSYLG